ncbi:MAG: YwiC-like family protein [Vicinamibacteraceae bacterium]|nr:YwiC-like family protein [Vicinamibacteraceae bacterium]
MLLPREHGTYGEILFPLVGALVVGQPTGVGWAIAAGAFIGYLAHEGAIVLAGRRGARAARESRRAALRSLVLFGGVAAVLLAWAVAGAGPLVRSGVLIAMVPTSLALAVAWAGRERSVGGEMLAGVALSSWGLPVALDGGVAMGPALACWAVWSASFAAATLAVRGLIARTKRQAWRPHVAGAAIVAAGAVAAAWWAAEAAHVPPGLQWTLAPTVLVVLVLGILPVPARRLKTIGWSLVSASAATLAALVAVF